VIELGEQSVLRSAKHHVLLGENVVLRLRLGLIEHDQDVTGIDLVALLTRSSFTIPPLAKALEQTAKQPLLRKLTKGLTGSRSILQFREPARLRLNVRRNWQVEHFAFARG